MIQEIKKKEDWENFMLAQDRPPFLQSWNTAEQYEAMGEKTWRLGIYDDSKLVGVALVILTRAKRGNYLYLPYGPVLKNWNKQHLVNLTEYLKQRGREEGFDFIRVSPFIERTELNKKLFQEAGYRISPIHMLAEELWVLDITPDEDDLLMNMRKTTRNLIRRAIKDEVEIKREISEEGVKKFIGLHDFTKDRHNFVAYPDQLFYEQVKNFAPDDQVIVWSASHQNELIASAIMMYYGNSASYHHGASKISKVPASYLIQWESIHEAKKRGFREYNFWGITVTEDKKHPFYGISRYKQGFGGELRYLLPAQDYPLTSKYWLNYVIESLRRVKRGFGWRRV